MQVEQGALAHVRDTYASDICACSLSAHPRMLAHRFHALPINSWNNGSLSDLLKYRVSVISLG